ncbi:hybrid sensor histidine kinase/response regulator [Crocosphaera sp. XPORK-15E]|uniref:hybrid sensor histidine kinase/response regulator n=1 Tax=Crocosphaera sp. XPORK-15E TaxID=3110247 RepID=UPI002B20ED1C|nr:hybrid sensor histidine kinase/response regulator [Crocosphaera sp. XPORK-15E]MEA5535877.1 hybrid sensor histidine kinase/response regulator [Crocosphaera sp. XPORK-15E]
MAKDKEQGIRWQFLGEAQEYLNALESGLLGLATDGVDRQKMDGALRAAHSIKGGAAMMGFHTLSDLAHRLEDFLKVLKVGGSHRVDRSLESLFLTSIDHLRQVAQWNRQGIDIDRSWLETQVNPVMAALYERLGDPQPEDATSLLSEEAGEDMVLLMFQTEVEGCLQRLESVLENPQQPCLLEEFLIAAQELEGLGQMLQLDAFSALCQSIIQGLETHQEQIKTIAPLGLQAWRRSQAMVIIGQREMMPTELDLSHLSSMPAIEDNLSLSLADAESEIWDNSFVDLEDTPLSFGFPSSGFFSSGTPQPVFRDESPQLPGETTLPLPWELEQETEELNILMTSDALKSYVTTAEFTEEAQEFLAQLNADETETANDFIIPPSVATTEDMDREEEQGTIRVPIKQLEALSDLFGELTIERNGSNLQLKRLRNLIELLSDRVQTLEQSNAHLRNTYEQVGERSPDKDSTLKSGQLSLQDFDLLEMDRYSDLHVASQEMMDTMVQLQEVTRDLQTNLDETEGSSRAFSRTFKLMQTTITQLRMRPIADLVGRFPMGLRQMALQYGKQVDLKIKGGSTLVDRTILDALNDPLLHLLRNAFDHGIETPKVRQAAGKPETGTIEISATYRGNKTIITVQDDGAGINLDKIRVKALQMGLDQSDLAEATNKELLDLIFEPGFTTAEAVTDLSGRGVGMDVVRTNLRQIRGEIAVATKPGQGTSFVLTVPFTLSVIRVLLVESGGMLLAFPNSVIEEMISLDPEMMMMGTGQNVLNWDGQLVPLIALGQQLDFARSHPIAFTEGMPVIDQPTVLMVAQGHDFVGIQVDRYWGEQEVTIRQVEGNLGMPPGFSGCTILGDGRVVPLVDATALLRWINEENRSSLRSQPQNLTDLDLRLTDAIAPIIMIVDDSINVRRFLALTLEKAGYQVEQAKDGQDALEKLQGGLSSRVQLIISDLEMPRLDGYGLLSHLKSDSMLKYVPVVMLTSRSGDKHRQLAMNLGASAYFSKPFKETELLATLEQLIKASLVK